ncbi:MAG: hypothetical protein KAJ07_00360 [Planctomycetes bacterium]|nr:hypothetical protein [Planctomycetota bacterium]
MDADIMVTRCECGAVTVKSDNLNQCVMEGRLDEFFPGLKVTEDNTDFHCNHCVNHWGVDLCECGSGETPVDCCGVPMEIAGAKKERPLWAS